MSKVEERYNDSREAPLYKATANLLYKVDDLLNFLQRDRKHTIGQHMLNIVLGMLDNVSLAYDFPEQRADQLKQYLTRYNNLSTLLELCEKKGYMCHNGKSLYIDFIKPLGVAHRQAKGWLKATIGTAGVGTESSESALE